MRWRDLTPKSIGNLFFFRPVALALIFALSAGAQCPPSSGKIFQSCNAAAMSLEQDAVQVYLESARIPPGDAWKIYRYGKMELRNDIRSMSVVRMLAIIHSDQRTPEEQQTYNWLQARVWENEKKLYQAALAEYRSFESNPCTFRPDPEVAAQYGLRYDPAPFCGQQGILALFGIPPQAPSREYYLTSALKKTYNQPFTDPAAQKMVADSMTRMASAVGITVLAGAVAVAAWVAVVASVAGIAAALFPFAAGAFAVVVVALAPLIPLLAAVAGVVAGIQVFDYERIKAELGQLAVQAGQVTANPPDLRAMANDGTGLYKLTTTLFAVTLPEFESSEAPPAHGTGDALFIVTPFGQQPLPASASFTYRDWDGAAWSAISSGAWLVHTKGGYSTLAPSFRYTDWEGNRMFASRTGANFRITKGAPADGDVDCPANAVTGYSAPANPSACRALVLPHLNLNDASGTKVTVRMSESPEITSVDRVTFTNGAPKAFDIDASGAPAPAVTVSALPNGVTFTQPSPGKGKLTFSGSAANGAYPVTVTAQNAQGTTTQTLQLTVGTALQITSPAAAKFRFYEPNSFRITTSGSGPVNFSLDLTLPQGLTLTNHGDGTATIGGTPYGWLMSGSCYLAERPCGIVASNPISTTSQAFTFTVEAPPAPSYSPSAVTFRAGSPNRALLVSSFKKPPVKFDLPCSAPSWLSLTDNGDGTAYLSGTPPANAAGEQRIYVPLDYALAEPVYVCYSYGDGGATPITNFSIQVTPSPEFTSANTAYGTAGSAGVFPIATNQISGAITALGTIPGMTLHDSGSGRAMLSGMPPAGSGGYYSLNLKVAEGGKTGEQILNWHTLEAPSIHTQDAVMFHTGMAGSFAVGTSGYPKWPIADLPQPSGEGMRLTLEGVLPRGILFSSQTAAGNNTGSGIFAGTAATGTEGIYPLTIKADNGTPPVASKPFMLIVTKAGDVNSDGATNCIDVVTVRAAMGTRRGFPDYVFRADINNDGVVDLKDLALASSRLASGTRCQ